MNNTFIYEQGWLVEKPDEHSENRKYVINNDEFIKSYEIFDKHLATLRRFKWNYPDPKREMELGKDFEVVDDEIPVNGDYANGTSMVAIPIDVWKEVEDILEYGSNPIEELKSKFIITKK